MSDSLRDRIAAVLIRDAFGMTTKSAAYRQADALIAEIGLIRDPFSTAAFHRYVTQWVPNGPEWEGRRNE